MGHQIGETKVVTTRKQQQCCYCGKLFPAGSTLEAWTWVDCGQPQRLYMPSSCASEIFKRGSEEFQMGDLADCPEYEDGQEAAAELND